MRFEYSALFMYFPMILYLSFTTGCEDDDRGGCHICCLLASNARVFPSVQL